MNLWGCSVIAIHMHCHLPVIFGKSQISFFFFFLFVNKGKSALDLHGTQDSPGDFLNVKVGVL